MVPHMSDRTDDKAEALKALVGGNPSEFVASWLVAIEQSGEEEKTWREKQAQDAVDAYEGKSSSPSTAFNIFHSNIETIVPALYNSSPIPDVRRRFNDEDRVAAEVSEILERGISFSIDDYEFNDVMKRVVKDMATVDRGIARIKYEPHFRELPEGEPQPDDADTQAGQSAQGGMGHNGGPDLEVEYEEARCEYVPWRSFRRGPATTWDRMPWVAFEHFLNRDEVKKLVGKSHYDPMTKALITAGVRFNYSGNATGSDKDHAQEVPKFGGRARVWEIWDKDTGMVVFIAHDYKDYPLCVMKDPLRLRSFFPCPRPAMIIEGTDSLTPITSFSIYSSLIEELNDITNRIKALVEQVRVRGGYAGVAAEVELIANADDGELVPLNSAELMATTGGGIDKAIFWFPIEPVVSAIKELVQQRELVKATIYEVTGLSDIIRGASDPNETATAQGIKQQWGSIRIQSHQKEVERYAADLFRLKAEIFCKHFDIQTLLMMTGLKYPTKADQQRAQQMLQMGEKMVSEFQASGQEPPPEIAQMMPQLEQAKKQLDEILAKPALEDIEGMMKSERVLRYRVDIESDSTVRADLTKSQEQMKGFLEGTAAYVGAVGPMVQQGAMDGQVAIEIFAAFARHFRLGKQAEDALDAWADRMKKGEGQEKSDPAAEAEAALKQAQAAAAQATAEKTKTETQLLPLQFKASVAKDSADLKMRARTQENADKGAHFDRMEAARGNRAKHKLEVGKAKAGHANARADLSERKATRQDANKNKRLELGESRKARHEGYAVEGKQLPPPEASAMPEGGGMPVAQDEGLTEYETDEERASRGQRDAVLGEVARGMQGLAHSQAQSTAALAQAISELASSMKAPKRIVRDSRGRAIGAEVVE